MRVVVVGGAATGSSVAFHLLSDPAFKGRVTVLERDPSYRLAASALSAASVRQQFSLAVNIRQSLFGVEFLREAERRLGADEPVDLGLHEAGYLFLASEGQSDAMRASHALQRREGADVALLGPGELGARFPWLSLDGVALGSLGLSGEGWFDGWSLLQELGKAARRRGAEYRRDELVGVELAGGRVAAARLATGERLPCDALVNCAGSQAPAICRMAGVEIPVQAKRRSVFSLHSRTPLPHSPLVIDTGGVWMRPEGRASSEGQLFIAGWSPPPDRDPDWLDEDPQTQDVDWPLFEEVVWPALAGRVPALAAVRPGRAWTGPYDVNRMDHNAVLGPAGHLPNFYLCSGFSGHGLQHAPAVGRGLADLIVHGRYLTLDLSELGYERIASGPGQPERNVI